MSVATQTALRDLNQTNRELRRSKLITQATPTSSLAMPDWPNKLNSPPFVSRDRSQPLARIRSRALEAYRRAAESRSTYRTHIHRTQETGSGIDERESVGFYALLVYSRRICRPYPEKLSEEGLPRFIIIASRGIQARSFSLHLSVLTSAQRDASSSGKLVSGLVYARDRRCYMNYGCIGYPAALADARVFPRFPDFQSQRTCFYTWLEKELFQARKTLDNIRGFWQARLRINRLNRPFYEEKKIDFIGLLLL